MAVKAGIPDLKLRKLAGPGRFQMLIPLRPGSPGRLRPTRGLPTP
jgi:hypothetical protein